MGNEALPDRLYLMGFMGSGKSALGAKLAHRLGYTFLDLDQAIAEQEGRSVPEIFSADGEAFFRKRETEVLHGTASLTRTLIALGGGTPCFNQNIDWINQHGLSIYLSIRTETLLGRLRRKKSGRPLLADLDDEGLRTFIEQTLNKREPYYRRAHFVLDAEGKTPEEAERIIREYCEAG